LANSIPPPKGLRSPLAQCTALQTVLLKVGLDPKTDGRVLAQVAVAWEKLEERKRILRMTPKPKDLDTTKLKKVPRESLAGPVEVPPEDWVERAREALPAPGESQVRDPLPACQAQRDERLQNRDERLQNRDERLKGKTPREPPPGTPGNQSPGTPKGELAGDNQGISFGQGTV